MSHEQAHLVAHFREQGAKGRYGGEADCVSRVLVCALAAAAAAPRGAAPLVRVAVALVRGCVAVQALQVVLVLLTLVQALAADGKGRVLRRDRHSSRAAALLAAAAARSAAAAARWLHRRCSGARPGPGCAREGGKPLNLWSAGRAASGALGCRASVWFQGRDVTLCSLSG